MDPRACPAPRSITIVGAGIVGMAAAWRLQGRGHRVRLVDPSLAGGDPPAPPSPPPEAGPLAEQPQARQGSRAALGVLMAQVFHRSSGRAWRLRQRSLALWQRWRQELAARDQAIPWRSGLLLLAADATELERQRLLVERRREQGLPLELWPAEAVAQLMPAVPASPWGGLHSPADGQLDPGQTLSALHRAARSSGLEETAATVVRLEEGPSGGSRHRWRLHLDDGGTLESDWVILSAGTASAALPVVGPHPGSEAAPAAPNLKLEPVLGQALELELTREPGWTWPGVVVWKGINLVPRPDLEGGRRFWLGATLEPGHQADPRALEVLRQLEGAAPPWLKEARIRRHWQGIRPRPVGRPAPVLETLAPGLLLVGGHYRNGVLLAPASAEWIVEQVEGWAPGG